MLMYNKMQGYTFALESLYILCNGLILLSEFVVHIFAEFPEFTKNVWQKNFIHLQNMLTTKMLEVLYTESYGEHMLLTELHLLFELLAGNSGNKNFFHINYWHR